MIGNMDSEPAPSAHPGMTKVVYRSFVKMIVPDAANMPPTP
jgi:hypothetical protein